MQFIHSLKKNRFRAECSNQIKSPLTAIQRNEIPYSPEYDYKDCSIKNETKRNDIFFLFLCKKKQKN